jgi:hypothetical protein
MGTRVMVLFISSLPHSPHTQCNNIKHKIVYPLSHTHKMFGHSLIFYRQKHTLLIFTRVMHTNYYTKEKSINTHTQNLYIGLILFQS